MSTKDFFMSKDECEKNRNLRIPSNIRYPSFTQKYFTCGDKDQFESNRDQTNGSNAPVVPEQNVWDGIWVNDESLKWKKYKGLTTESVDNTFNYIFNKFKKGLFIKIKNNILSVFLPFSKNSYINEWGDRMLYDQSKYKNMTDFLIHCSRLQGYDRVTERNILQNPYMWYANNCLVRYENPLEENDRGLSCIRDMLLTLCSTRVVPDIELFINKRDFPLIRKDDCEPYDHIFGKLKLLSHKYDRYCPILSSVSTAINTDIPFPTAEDWARCSNQEDGKFFTDFCRSYKENFSKPWKERIPVAVFRGASTGCGTTIQTNPRLKISSMSINQPRVPNGSYPLLDAGITKWNLRPRKTADSQYLQIIDPKIFPLVKPLTPSEQTMFKYIVNVDGHVSAFRLSFELSMGSVILLVDSKYRMWFRKYLVEYVHYVPVKEDLSDLFEKITWCRLNDEKCEEISKNALDFYKRYLSKDGILDFLQHLFIEIKTGTGDYFYNTMNVQDVVTNNEHTILSKLQSITDPSPIPPDTKLIYPFGDRNFYGMEGLQLYIRKKGGLEVPEKSIVHESKSGIIYKGSDMIADSNLKIIIKKSQRVNELINEVFVGLTSTNQLIREIPNFRYVYCVSRSSEGIRDQSLLEDLSGVTFQKYINEGCSFESYRKIILQILLALAVSQERVGFVHNDLYPWNIIMMPIERRKIVYQFREYVYVVETELVPVFIDYGRSHVIYDGEHYGTINSFKTSLFQDCFCILVSSTFEMMSNVLKPQEVDSLIYIINFFTNNTDIFPTKIKTKDELLRFLNIKKKYNEMVFGNKCGVESHNPIDLFHHIYNSGTKEGVDRVLYPEQVEYVVPISNPSFYYEIIIGGDPTQKVLNYIENIEQKYEGILSSCKNPVVYINSCNLFTLTSEWIKKFSESYIPLISRNRVNSACNRIRDRVGMKYLVHIEEYTKKFSLGYINYNSELIMANYTSNSFSIPGEILTMVQRADKIKSEDIITFRNMLVFNMFYGLTYRLPEEVEQDEKLLKLSTLSPLTIKNNNANINTLKSLCKGVYDIDIEELSKMEMKPVGTLNKMKEILSIV